MAAHIGYFDTLKSIAGKVFSYLSSITLTGTDGKIITCTQDTTLDEAVAMSSKLTIPGAWTTPAFNAGDFVGQASMTWTVEAGDVLTFAYIITGKIMTVAFSLYTTTVAGTLASLLIITIPAGKIATKLMYNAIHIVDNGVAGSGHCYVQASNASINCQKENEGNWAASTNATYIMGEITFEIN